MSETKKTRRMERRDRLFSAIEKSQITLSRIILTAKEAEPMLNEATVMRWKNGTSVPNEKNIIAMENALLEIINRDAERADEAVAMIRYYVSNTPRG